MDGGRERAYAIETITERVSNVANRVVSQQLALQIAVCCALRNPEEALTFVTNRATCGKMIDHANELRISIYEYNQLFGFKTLTAHASDQCVQLISRECVREVTDVIESSLKYALEEQLQSDNWRKPLCRLASVLAREVDETSEALRVVVGAFGESDARRLSDAREHMEEEVGANLEAVNLALDELMRAFGIS